MLVDARTVERDAILRTDLCIIGAGAAGLTLANALAECGASIALIESGGWSADARVQSLYEGAAVGDLFELQPGYLTRSRLRYFGGSTNHWTGWCVPLEPIDFERREWVRHSGWPFPYDELAPYYRRAAAILEVPPFDQPVSERLRESRQLLLAESSRVITRFFHFSPPTRLGVVHRDALTADRKSTRLNSSH